MRLAELSVKTWIGAEHGVSRAQQNETIGRTVKKKKYHELHIWQIEIYFIMGQSLGM